MLGSVHEAEDLVQETLTTNRAEQALLRRRIDWDGMDRQPPMLKPVDQVSVSTDIDLALVDIDARTTFWSHALERPSG